MKKNQAFFFLILILLAAFFLRQYRLLDFPYHGDEVDEGDIALEILHGHLALFYPQNEGNEPLYHFSLAPFFAALGDSVIANRWPSAAWGMALVALMYTYARVLFASRRVGVMAAGLAAALWWPTVFGRLGLREISLPVMMLPALLALVIILRGSSDQRTLRAGMIGGIFAGLTPYTFPAGRGFPVIVILFLTYTAFAHRDRLREHSRAFLIYFVVMITISLPLWAHLAMYPEQDFRVRELAGRSWLLQGKFAEFLPALRDTLGMFTVRGDMNWMRNIAGRPVFVGLEGWLFYLGVALCLWRWRKPEYALQLFVLATMLAPNVLAEDPPRWTRSIGILPALIAITVLPIEYGWARIENFSRLRSAYASLVLLLSISIYSRTAFDLFDVWIDHPGVYWMTLAFYDSAGKYINRLPDTTPVNYVMDVYTDWRKHNVQRVVQRDKVELRWTVKNAFVFPKDQRGTHIAFQIFGDPARPLQSAFLEPNAPVYIDPRADPEGNRPLRIYFVPRARIDEHLVRARTGAIISPDSNAPLETFTVSDQLQFLGYEILDPSVRAGQDLNVLTYWQVLRRPPELAIFLHLLDSNGRVVAQYDGFDVIVDELKRGDLVVQLHTLKLAHDLPMADYRFEIGAYTRADLQRIPLPPDGDHLWLQTWQPARP